MIVCTLSLLLAHRQTLRVSPLFSDNMVLQRGMADPVFGSGTPGQTVTVTIAGQTQTTSIGEDAKWMLRLNPMPAGGPFDATIQAPGSSITLKNVAVGEVWLCSGQSNMERLESAANDYPLAQEEADSDIRMFSVSKVSTEEPASEIQGDWVPASKTTVGSFSAVALAFGRELHDRLKVPVGLVVSTWGGTRAEAWMSREAIAGNGLLKGDLDAYLSEIKDFSTKYDAYKTELHAWIATRSDKGNEGYLQGWAQPHIYETDWKAEPLPGTLDTMEPQAEGQPFDGAVWFRRTFVMPDAWQGKALKLELGPIRDYDDTYINGKKVGSTKEVSLDPRKAARTYRVSPGIPTEGVNSIAVRVFSAQGICGFTGFPEQMRISPMDDPSAEPVPLAGEWFEKVERKVDVSEQPPHMPIGPGNPAAPGGLFNGMIAPLIPFAVKGVIWYQGESDAPQPARYRVAFPLLIHDWRKHWGEGDMPFYFVQLANYHDQQPDPGDSDWAELREAQAAALKLTHTGMAVAIDIGDAKTIHPTNKREVGRRLSLIALSRDYSVHTDWNGPEFRAMSVTGNALRVFFKHAEDGFKTSDGKEPRGFAIAGADRKFYWAEAKVEGDAIVLTSPKVPNPVAVRYGWADNPDDNLYNANGLPAVPFRTDSWPRPAPDK